MRSDFSPNNNCHTYNNMDQPCKVTNPARGQLNRENDRDIFLSPFAPENLVSRDGFGSPVPRQFAHLTAHHAN